MSRLTDERIEEILRPKDLMGETELESLAREVRELRESVNALDKDRDDWTSAAKKMADGINDREATIERLTRERDSWKEAAKRMDAENNRLASDRYEANGVIKTLTRERDELQRTIDLQRRQISHQARQCQEIETERDAARKFNRRFRSFFRPTMKPDIVKYGCHGPCEDRDKLIDDYDATQTQQPQPTQTEWVPWTAETRPGGPVWLREIRKPLCEEPAYWDEEGHTPGNRFRVSWMELRDKWEWTRDGKEWQRCGVEVAK